MYGHREGEVGTCMDTERVRWVHVWTHRGWGGYRYGHTERVRWVHVWTQRGWGGYRYGHIEGEVGTCMDT